jgi:hypothetical protein
LTESNGLAFSILGHPFEASGVNRDLATWLRAWWDYPEHALTPHPHRIALVVDQEAPLRPTTGKPRRVELPDCILHFTEGDGWWETGETESGLHMSIGPSITRIAVWGMDRWSAGAERFYSSLHAMLLEAVRAEGFMPLHAAAASLDGAVKIWLGPSGGGKSTTLLHAARAGWTPIAEDLCWLDPQSLMLYGWDRSVRVWPDTLERYFPDLIPVSVAELDGKRSVPYREVGSGARSGRLARIAILAHDREGSSGTEVISSADAVRALWEATGVPLSPSTTVRMARDISRLVKTSCITRAVLGDPPLAR